MPGQLKISVGLVQTMNVAFQCRVEISGGMPLDDVELRLWQSAGMGSLYSGRGKTTLDASGNGLVVFDDVCLDGPCTARLVADEIASSTPLHMDDVHLQVVR